MTIAPQIDVIPGPEPNTVIDSSTVFKPYSSWQLKALKSKAPILLLTGGAGGGKSRIAAEKIHALAIKYPGITGLVGRKDRTSANRSVVPFLIHTVQGSTNWGVYKKVDSCFEYSNGSVIWVVGMKDEYQRESLKSIGQKGGIDFIWIEEATAITEDDHELLLSRMRGTAANWMQVIYTCNPDHPEHWINKRLITNGEAEVYYSYPGDNPYNPHEYIDYLNSLTGIYRDRLVYGKWVQASGAVYDNYDPARHLIDWRILPKDDRYILSIDFGYTAPFSASLWHVDNDNCMTLYKQIYKSQTLVEDHARAILKMIDDCKREWLISKYPIEKRKKMEDYLDDNPNVITGLDGYNIEAVIVDHDSEDRATLEKHLKMNTKPAYKSVKSGIENVYARFEQNKIKFMNGALVSIDERLIDKKLPKWTAEEISGYVWSDKKQDNPVKSNDHGLDEMRYCAAYIDNIDITTISIYGGVI